MKRILMMIMTCFLLTGLYGCGNSKNDKDPVKSLTEKSIIKDMNESELVDVYINSDVKKMEVDSVEIEKASQEGNSYTVYCIGEQSCDEYNYKGQYVLYYNYYEVGGWILDAYEVKNYHIEALIEVPEPVERICIQSLGYLDENIEKVSTKKDSSEEYDYVSVYKVKENFAYLTKNHEMTIKSYFDGFRWMTEVFTDYVTEDWSALYGTWKGTPDENSKTYFNVNIKSIEDGLMNYTYEFYNYDYKAKDMVLYTENKKQALDFYDNIFNYDYAVEFACLDSTSKVEIAIGKDTGIKVHANNGINYIMVRE